jgi:hypothetical protein
MRGSKPSLRAASAAASRSAASSLALAGLGRTGFALGDLYVQAPLYRAGSEGNLDFAANAAGCECKLDRTAELLRHEVANDADAVSAGGRRCNGGAADLAPCDRPRRWRPHCSADPGFRVGDTVETKRAAQRFSAISMRSLNDARQSSFPTVQTVKPLSPPPRHLHGASRASVTIRPPIPTPVQLVSAI